MQELDQSSDVCFRYFVHHSDGLMPFIYNTQNWSDEPWRTLEDALINCFYEVRYDCHIREYWSDLEFLLKENDVLIERAISMFEGISALCIFEDYELFNPKSAIIEYLMSILFPNGSNSFKNILQDIEENTDAQQKYYQWITRLISWYKDCYAPGIKQRYVDSLTDPSYLARHMEFGNEMAPQFAELIQNSIDSNQ